MKWTDRTTYLVVARTPARRGRRRGQALYVAAGLVVIVAFAAAAAAGRWDVARACGLVAAALVGWQASRGLVIRWRRLAVAAALAGVPLAGLGLVAWVILTAEPVPTWALLLLFAATLGWFWILRRNEERS